VSKSRRFPFGMAILLPVVLSPVDAMGSSMAVV
jgi:hypothetical protein